MILNDIKPYSVFKFFPSFKLVTGFIKRQAIIIKIQSDLPVSQPK